MDFSKIAKKQTAPISGGGYTNIRMAFVDDLLYPIYVDTDNSDGTLHIEAVDYLRLQDILASHKHKQKKVANRKSNNRKSQIKDNQFTGRKGFYTKSIYTHLTPIVWDLAYGFTDEVKQQIREQFKEYIVTTK